MAAGIRHLKAEVAGNFLADLNVVAQGLSISCAHASAFVERELSVDQITMIPDDPLHADGVAIENFFVRFEDHFDIPIGPVTFLLVTNQVRDESRRHKFVVTRAAGVIVAVLFNKLEGIERPVLASRLDNI